MNSHIEIQGHRGSRGTHPENTWPSFATAIATEADVIEMDLLMTQDGEIVLHHDFCIHPIFLKDSNGSPLKENKWVKDTSLAELKSYDFGQLKNEKFPKQKMITGITILTLQDFFRYLETSVDPHAKKILLNLEIKADPTTPFCIPSSSLVVKKIVEIVREAKMAHRVYYSSFDFSILQELRKEDAEATLGVIIGHSNLEHYAIGCKQWVNPLLDLASQVEAKILSPHYTLLKLSKIQPLHEAGLSVIPWTINDPQIYYDVVKMGANGIITDYPSEMVKLKNVL